MNFGSTLYLCLIIACLIYMGYQTTPPKTYYLGESYKGFYAIAFALAMFVFMKWECEMFTLPPSQNNKNKDKDKN